MKLTLFRITLLTLICCSVSISTFSNPNIAISDLKFSVLVTAESSGSLESFVVADGSWFTKRKLVHTAVLVTHPKGDFLFDSGIGQDFEEQMSVFSFFEQQLFKIENVHPAKEQLAQENYDLSKLFAIIPSHMHWDHASGLEDFIEVPVWLQKVSHDEALHGEPPGFILSQYDDSDLRWNYLDLTNSEYEGFSKTLDVFDDGSVVLVDLTGHTHGQLGMFLNLPSGERYFFIGDTTWSELGVIHNKPRPKFVDWMVGVDTDFELNSVVINQIHKLNIAKPNIVIVPAHDELVVASLPIFPTYSK